MDDMRTHDENLLVVAAVEGYSWRHDVPAQKTIGLFFDKDLLRTIRENYPVLHTQDLEESVDFAEDVLELSEA